MLHTNCAAAIRVPEDTRIGVTITASPLSVRLRVDRCASADFAHFCMRRLTIGIGRADARSTQAAMLDLSRKWDSVYLQCSMLFSLLDIPEDSSTPSLVCDDCKAAFLLQMMLLDHVSIESFVRDEGIIHSLFMTYRTAMSGRSLLKLLST
eukprot:9143375-Heterocapsa_arctica.AAC.1